MTIKQSIMKPTQWHIYGAVLSISCLTFSGVFIETSMNIAFPTLIEEFSINPQTVQWLTTSYLLTLSITLPVSAYLIHNFSSRRLFGVANLLFLFGLLFSFFSPSFLLLVCGRLLQGIGTGIVLPLMYDIVMKHAPTHKRGRLIGLSSMVASLAPTLGPSMGGLLVSTFSWRVIFLCLIPIMLGSLIVGTLSFPCENISKSQQFPLYTFISLSGGLVCLLRAIEQLSLVYISLSLVFIGLFLRHNKKVQLINLKVLSVTPFTRLSVGILSVQAILLGLSFIVSNYLQLGLGWGANSTGIGVAVGALMLVIFAPISGRLYDKYHSLTPSIIGLSMVFVSLIVMLFSAFYHQALLLIGANTLLMIGIGLSNSNLMLSILERLGDTHRIDGTGIFKYLPTVHGGIVNTCHQ